MEKTLGKKMFTPEIFFKKKNPTILTYIPLNDCVHLIKYYARMYVCKIM